MVSIIYNFECDKLSIKFRIWRNYFSDKYIPLISRVRGPYGKLFRVFSFLLWPKAKRVGRENKEGKIEDP